MANPEEHLKECYRLVWLIKGHLNLSEEDALSSYNGYFKRVWYNEESWVHEEGFDEAWEEREQRIQKEIVKVACLGGHFD